MSDTAIAVTDQKISGWVNDLAPELVQYAARKYDGNSWAKTAMLAIIENKDLRGVMSTENGRISMHHALRRAGSLGLSLNPQEGKACLVAYKEKVSYQVMKDGYIELILDTGAVEFVKVGTVYENDGFELTETNHGSEFRFSPARKERGKIDGFFGSITLKNGTCITKYITAEQAIEHRKKYSQYSQLGEKEYGEKTVAKMLCKGSKVAPLTEIAAERDESESEPLVIGIPPEKGTSSAEVSAALDEKRAAAAKPAPAATPEPQAGQQDKNLDIF